MQPEALLKKPLEALDHAWLTEWAAHHATEAMRTGSFASLAAPLRAALSDEAAAAAVPCLNACRPEAVPPGALVRFVGMVQDVHDPEFYVGAYDEVLPDGSRRVRTGKFRDELTLAPGGEVRPREQSTWCRTPLVCVPVPGESAWVSRGAAGAAGAPPPAPRAAAKKRGASDDGGGDEAAAAAAAPAGEAMSVDDGAKRARDGAAAAAAATAGADAPLRCEPCGDGDAPTGDAPPAEAADAWSRAAAGAYLVKVYDGDGGGDDEPALRVNEVVEVWGVLELGVAEPMAAADAMDDNVCIGVEGHADGLAALVAQERALRPPPSAQPRLHCFVHRKLERTSHPLLPPPGAADEALALSGARAQLAAIRPALIAALGASLGGDVVAGELVLLAVISRVVGRHGAAPLGKLHLNVSGCPPPAAGAPWSPAAVSVVKVLSDVLPQCAALGLSPAKLNAARYVPSKDVDANTLRGGALQLPLGATLVLDEAQMSEGKLDAAGIKNVRALADVLERQKLGYDFTYFEVDFEADATLVSLSTSPSMLPLGCEVPLRLDAAAAAPPAELATGSWLAMARAYVGLAVRAQRLEVPEEMTALLQDDFVRSRQATPSITAEDFARWLTTTRLLAASHLEPAVRPEHYHAVKALEMQRLERRRAKDVAL